MSSVKKEKNLSTDLRYYISLSADKLQSKWKTIVIFIPFAWLLLFFLTPFFIVAKISLAELVITSPPFSKMIEWVDGGVITIRLVFDNFIYIFDLMYIASRDNSELRPPATFTSRALMIDVRCSRQNYVEQERV